jgi:hypothetical protein
MATRTDLNGVLDNIATLLSTNNTTTSSVQDLSANLETRVLQVLKIHPGLIVPGADIIPFVTCFIDKKTIEDQTIAKNKLSIQRQALLNVEVVGCVFNTDFNSIGNDPADVEVHYLMENIEYLLRSDDTLSGKVSWHVPREVNYYDQKFDEQTHLRMGILSLECKIFY